MERSSTNKRSRLIRPLTVVMLVFMLSAALAGIIGCRQKSQKSKDDDIDITLDDGNGKNTENTATHKEETTENTDNGQVKVVYKTPKSKELKPIADDLKQSGLFNDIVEDLNEELKLPSGIKIVLEEGGEPNAYYDPEKSELVLTYELIQEFEETFSSIIKSEEKLNTAVGDALLFVSYHELGHALIDKLDLPVTGKEEDDADQLATVLLVTAGKEGAKAAMDGGIWLFENSKGSKIQDLDLADVHSLDKQRYYNILTWIYGSDPEEYSYIVDKKYLPEDRAEGAEDEFKKVAKSWARMLEPYIKDTDQEKED